MLLVIDPQGQGQCLHGEAIDLSLLGQLTIHRASYVEPDIQGSWWADLSLVGGPRLGPYVRRSEALAAEQAWLEERWLGGAAPTPDLR